MARPRKKNLEKQSQHLPPARCTDAEYERIAQKARHARLSLSAYIRQSALKQKITVKKGQTDAALVFQLRKLAININQQTKKLHQTGNIPPELRQLWNRLSWLLDHLIGEGK